MDGRLKLQPGTIIQVTNPSHPWLGTLLVVSELKTYGVMAYVVVPRSNNGSEFPAVAYINLNAEDFEVCGFAKIGAFHILKEESC